MDIAFGQEEKIDILKYRGYRIAKMPAIWYDLDEQEHTEEITIAVTPITWDEVKDLHYKTGIKPYSVEEVFKVELHKAIAVLMKTIAK